MTKNKDKKRKVNKEYIAGRNANELAPLNVDHSLLTELMSGIDPDTLSQVNEVYRPQLEAFISSIASNQFQRVIHGRAVSKVSQYVTEIIRLQDSDRDAEMEREQCDTVAKARIQGTRDKVLAVMGKIEALADVELRERRLRDRDNPMFHGEAMRDDSSRLDPLDHPVLRQHYIDCAERAIKMQLKGVVSNPFADGLFMLLQQMHQDEDKAMQDVAAGDVQNLSSSLSNRMQGMFEASIGLSITPPHADGIVVKTLRNVLLEIVEATGNGRDNVFAWFKCSGCRETIDKGVE